MDRITIQPFVFDQQRLLFWGVPCGYCGTHPNMPVCFLVGRQNTLSAVEKADVIEYVIEHVGPVKRTYQTKEAFDVIDSRRNSSSK